jgi:hypothetical protein
VYPQRLSETVRWFFKKINKINKPLAKLTKRKREITHRNRDEKADTTKHTNDIQKIKEYFENLYFNRLENLEEMNKFLDAYNLPKLNKGI